MAFLPVILLIASFLSCQHQNIRLACSATIYSNLINTNANFSSLDYIDYNGAFLTSPNDTFRAGFFSSSSHELTTGFYLSVFHFSSNVVIWTANHTAPLPSSGLGMFFLTPAGITLTGDDGTILWSTPSFDSPVQALLLADTGNLILLDKSNALLWQSFDHPTDTIVSGQHLPVGKSLTSASSEQDFTPGQYKLMVTDQDAELQWKGQTYWKLSMDTKAFKSSNSPAGSLAINETSLALFGGDRTEFLIQVFVGNASILRMAKLEPSGKLTVASFLGGERLQEEFVAPLEERQLPLRCGKLGFFTDTPRKGCYCPSGFHGKDCGVLTDESYSLPPACNPTSIESDISYIGLDASLDYFANHFKQPAGRGASLSGCQDMCSKNCSCLGVFFEVSSGACVLVENDLGSLMMQRSSSGGRNDVGYIKIVLKPEDKTGGGSGKRSFPFFLVLFPVIGFLIIGLAVLGILRRRRNKVSTAKSSGWRSSSFFTPEINLVLGAPLRYDYEEIVAATENFKNQIGSGGFGVVYKGTLPDKTAVAVKKITSSGAKGKEEFYAEIAILGKIHHINLVRLRGFCVQGNNRFLILEYMSHGSLDGPLFGSGGPVLHWPERLKIALGTARGLEYLHSLCDPKIIHFDVKPENILLHGGTDHVKVSDFGLSKLLSSEESVLFTTMRGTIGYLAPEWLVNSGITDKTDVYSYGMVLLEIVRGERNWSLHLESSDTYRVDQINRSTFFPLLALEMHEEGRYSELADRRLEGKVVEEEVRRLVTVALCCVQLHPMLRPSMADVVGMLEGRIPLREPLVESLNFLRAFGRGFVATHPRVRPTILSLTEHVDVVRAKAEAGRDFCRSLGDVSLGNKDKLIHEVHRTRSRNN